MKEYTFILSKDIHKGLRQTDKSRRNIETLTKAVNVKAGDPYMDIPTLPSLATNVAPTISHPFPQVLDGRGQTFLCNANTINTLNLGNGTYTPLTTYDAFNKANVKALTGGGYWHMADFDSTYFLFNGIDMVFRDGRDNYISGSTPRTYTQDVVRITTGTSHRGRIVMGGFRPTPQWISAWQTLFATWDNLLPSNLQYPFAEIDTNWVFWSSIGGFDFPLAFIYPEIIMEGFPIGASGVFTDTFGKSFFLELLKRNELGWMPMRWDGEVLCVKSIGNNVAVYGNNGISILLMTNGNLQQDVPPTFGIMDMSRVGVMNRACVAGDDRMHIFLGNDYRLYSMAEGKIERLDYQEHMSRLIGASTVITYDSVENQYFISDGVTSFLLNTSGLTEVTIKPTSVIPYRGVSVGVFNPVFNEEVEIQTQVFDMGIRGIKTVASVNLGMQTDTPVYVAIKTRYGPGEDWITSRFVKTNKEGNVTLRVSGVDFIVIIKADDYTEFTLDSIQVKWQASDKRTIRGIYANQDVT
jgi:hypothetical protein